jgi:hypothetical protein
MVDDEGPTSLYSKAEMNAEFLNIDEVSEGSLAAVWSRPAEGFVLRSDVRRAEGTGRPDKWLVPNEGEWETVIPLRHPELLDRFRDIGQRPSELRVVGFANRYGFLGSPVSLNSISGGSLDGESLTDWRRHAGTVAALCYLWEYVDVENSKALAPFVEWYTDPLGVAFKVVTAKGRPDAELTAKMITARPYRSVAPAVPDDSFVDAVIIAEDGDRLGLLTSFRRGDTVAPTRQYLVWKVNQLLHAAGGISRIVTPDGDIWYFPQTLLAAILLRLQDMISGRRLPERDCRYWWGRKGRHRFKPTRKDKDFCNDSCRKLYKKGEPNGA